MVSGCGPGVLPNARVAYAQWAPQMHPARQGRWNGMTVRRRLSAAARLLALGRDLWTRLKLEQRMYMAALLLGVLLNLWAGLAALQAQGRFPHISFDLPNVDDLSLPGRPVLRPVLDPGELRTFVSAAATQGRLTAALDDVEAVVDIPAPGITPPVKLVLQANLPRLFAPDPPI